MSMARPQQTPSPRAVALLVPDNVETVVQSFTVPGGSIWLDEVVCTGTWAAEFRFYVDGVHVETKRLEVSNGHVAFDLRPGKKLRQGQVAEARVVHYHAGEAHDFEATFKFHR